MKTVFKKTLSMTAVAMLLTASLAAHAGTATQNITITGTVSPPPVTCSFSGASPMNFTGSIDGKDPQLHSTTSISVTCSNNAPYTLSAPTLWNPATVGGVSASVALYDGVGKQDLFNAPYSGVGTGSPQVIPLDGDLGGPAGGDLDPINHIGVVSGSVQLTLAY